MYLSTLQQGGYAPIERVPAFGLGGLANKLSHANQDFRQLSEALNSGDVEGAQSTFNDLKKVLQSAGSIGAASSVKDSLDSLGKDLGSGSVSLAQQDLRRLQTNLESVAGKSRNSQPGLPVRLPGGVAYQTGLAVARSAAQTVGHLPA